MARLHPLFGPGVESFSFQYEKLYISPGHQYVQTPKYDVAPYYASAHNLYFQTAAGKGILGLFSLFGVFAAVFILVWRGIFSSSAAQLALSQPQRLILMMTLAYTCALAIYGNVGEIFYSPIGYISFVLFFAACIGTVPATYCLSRRFRIWVLGLLACAFVLHLFLEFGVKLGL
jgi:O-antigen ligase